MRRTYTGIYSGALAHEPLVNNETFTHVQTLIATAGKRPDGTIKPEPASATTCCPACCTAASANGA
ncbi:hypothetical protein [Micromonospora sp. KC213]|uniref:hypothetical protein n=1 Tax=Micromonospora sp. KC213 TaxID=2530378 RepID=UPI001404565A|nr:hypothetical protein [Micromonospora sp. KC213]